MVSPQQDKCDNFQGSMQMRSTALFLCFVMAGAVGAVGCKDGAEPPTGSASGAATKGGKPYSIQVSAPAETAVGRSSVATVTLEPRGGYKVNIEYPLKLSVTAPAAAQSSSRELTKADARELTEKKAKMEVDYQLGVAGEHRFSGKLRFSVCTETLCEVFAEDVGWVTRTK
jgi:hypothetical protein